MNQIGRIFLTWRRILQKRIHPTGCTLKQHYLLKRLSGTDFIRPTEVAEELFCDKPTASVIIKNLERKNWITRRKDPENGRSFLLKITEEGRKKQKEAESVLDQMEDPLSCLSEEERRQLKELLGKIEKSLPG